MKLLISKKERQDIRVGLNKGRRWEVCVLIFQGCIYNTVLTDAPMGLSDLTLRLDFLCAHMVI